MVGVDRSQFTGGGTEWLIGIGSGAPHRGTALRAQSGQPRPEEQGALPYLRQQTMYFLTLTLAQSLVLYLALGLPSQSLAQGLPEL